MNWFVWNFEFLPHITSFKFYSNFFPFVISLIAISGTLHTRQTTLTLRFVQISHFFLSFFCFLFTLYLILLLRMHLEAYFSVDHDLLTSNDFTYFYTPQRNLLFINNINMPNRSFLFFLFHISLFHTSECTTLFFPPKCGSNVKELHMQTKPLFFSFIQKNSFSSIWKISVTLL